MLPTINGKSFLECNIDDLKTILDNTDFKESEYLDYKKSFELTEIPKTQKDALDKAKAEFRKDVCAFANAQGGYLIYGIKEDGKAVPHELVGIEISDSNTEQFENIIKNTLQTVSPRIPHFELSFIRNGEKYIVVLRIYHDFFAPYVFVENNQDYRVYKRVGNSVKVMTYVELKTMFTQSISLEKEIELFRKSRIDHFLHQDGDQKQKEGRFLLLHIIPETFLDSEYNKPLFALQQKGALFSTIFQQFECNSRPFPIPEGLRFLGRGVKAECRLYNNGTAEFYYSLSDSTFCYINGQRYWLDYNGIWYRLSESIRAYLSRMSQFYDLQRVFICASIVGCKNVATEENAFLGERSLIDRDCLLCPATTLDTFGTGTIDENEMSLFHLDYMTSLGVRFDSDLQKIIKKVYGDL